MLSSKCFRYLLLEAHFVAIYLFNKIFNTNIPFCALEIFSLMCLLKLNFWSSCKPKYSWETLHSTGTSLKKTWGWKGFIFFRENMASWACLVILGLNIIFHWYSHSEIFFKSLSIFSVEALKKVDHQQKALRLISNC